MTLRVLLTGATGFVGRHVLAALLASGGCEVVAVSRKPPTTGGDPRLTWRATSDLFAERDEWHAAACADVDTVIHCAWYAEPGRYQQSARNLNCLRGTIALAQGALAAGVKRFVGVGTCVEYRLGETPLSIGTPIAPASPYAAAKAATYLALSEVLPGQGMSFAWCRLFYLHGDGEHPQRLVASIRARLERGEPADLGSGNQIRDYMDVADAGRAIASIALSDYVGAANVCSGKAVTVRAIAEAIADEFGRRDLLKFGVRPDNPIDPPFVVGVPYPPLASS